MRFFLIPVLCLVAGLASGAANAQAEAPRPAELQSLPAEEAVLAALEDNNVDDSDALITLLQQRDELLAERETLKNQLQQTRDEVEQEELRTQVSSLREQIDAIEEQFSSLATGIASSEFDLASGQAIDLKSEFEKLLEPFVIMMRSATDDARQIEQYRRTISEANHNQTLAQAALNNIDDLLQGTQDKPDLNAELAELKREWQKRSDAAKDLALTTSRQLEQKRLQKEQEQNNLGGVVGAFFVDRGLSLAFGVTAFVLVFGVLYSLCWLAGRWRRRRKKPRNFRVRLLFLLWVSLSVVVAAVAMLAVFNLRNDWFLMGLTLLVLLALSWFGIKLLPSLLEQIVLYLNLGAVQQDERLMFNGVPWRVSKLAFHTDLENPALAYGTFTLPIRELSGLHSRPTSHDEPWFPTQEGDWVKLDNGVGKIVFQSPEMVRIVQKGGVRRTFNAADFYANPPANISQGVRVEHIFGISYKHQAEAPELIPVKLKDYVEQGLLKILPAEHLHYVEVELMTANSSSLDFEVEADIAGEAAGRFEEVERALARLCVAACNEFGWEIPFPQMVLHQAD